MSFNSVSLFEEKIASFFNSGYCVMTDSCTHAIELCLRLEKLSVAVTPKQTYISVPFTFEKLGLKWYWSEKKWSDYYYISDNILDAAVFWRKDGYIPGTLMCHSFQYKKHLSLGRGGCILLDNKFKYEKLKKLSYDGRDFDISWQVQNISEIGYHYYMTPEIAELGLQKLPQALKKQPKKWTYKDYPDLSKMEVFQ